MLLSLAVSGFVAHSVDSQNNSLRLRQGMSLPVISPSPAQTCSDCNLATNLHRRLGVKPLGHLNEKYIDYLMYLKEKINPESRDFSIVHAAAGPTIIAPLLLTNATEIISLDKRHFIFPRLLGLIENYSSPIEIEDHDSFENALGFINKDNFWWNGSIDQFGIETLLITEMKRIGIREEDIKGIEYNDDQGIILEFDWAYPGEVAKTRKIIFKQGKLPETLDDLDLSKCDAYLHKAAMLAQKDFYQYIIAEKLGQKMKPGAFLMLGPPLLTDPSPDYGRLFCKNSFDQLKPTKQFYDTNEYSSYLNIGIKS